MSSELLSFIVEAARYLFVFFAVLLLLRAFLWLRSGRRAGPRDHREDRVGELVVLSGNGECPEGLVFTVPTEGVLGSVRSCDITVPDNEIRRNHCFFSHDEKAGLRLFPQSGCDILVDSVLYDCRNGSRGVPLVSGGILQIGGLVLRYQDAGAFPVAPQPVPVPSPDPAFYQPEAPYTVPPAPESAQYPAQPGNPYGTESYPGYDIGINPYSGYETGCPPFPRAYPESPVTPNAPECAPITPVQQAPASVTPPRRKRRSERWEEDWSE